jgi:hypothetical protein
VSVGFGGKGTQFFRITPKINDFFLLFTAKYALSAVLCYELEKNMPIFAVK